MRRSANGNGWRSCRVLLDPAELAHIARLGVRAHPESMLVFWQGWMKWSVSAGIDFFIGRKIPSWLDSLGLQDVAGEGHTAHFNGGSDWASYWKQTVSELAPALLKSAHITPGMLEDFRACYEDPRYWTSVITFVANWGRKQN
jgi:hypothetical protein